MSNIRLEEYTIKSCRRLSGNSSICYNIWKRTNGKFPYEMQSFQTKAARLRKYHYQKQHHRRKVPVPSLIIKYLSLVPLLQCPNQHFLVSNVRHFATRCRKATDTGSHGVFITRLRCSIRPAGFLIWNCQGALILILLRLLTIIIIRWNWNSDYKGKSKSELAFSDF